MFRKLLACFPLLALYACGDKDAACDNGARACDGDVLQECVDGAWLVELDVDDDAAIAWAELATLEEFPERQPK